MRLALASLLVAVVGLAPARAAVVVVNGDAAALQAAVSAAADGDILLIKPGSGGPTSAVTVDGKSLTLVVDHGSYDVGQLIVRNLPAGGQVTVHGLTCSANSLLYFQAFVHLGAVEVRDCAGSVWLDECTLAPPAQPKGALNSSNFGVHGLLAVNSQDVVLTDCSVTGGAGAPENCQSPPGYAPATEGGDALRAQGSRLALHGVVAVGGLGGFAGGSFCGTSGGMPGGEGLRMLGASRVLSADSSLRGANDVGTIGGPGSGLVIESASGSFVQRGGSVSQGSGLPAVPAIVAPPGTVSSYAAPPRGLTITSPLRVGGAAVLSIEGVAGEMIGVFEAPAGGWLELPAKQGVFLLGAPLVGPVLALANASGTLSIPFTAPPVLPPGVDGMTVHLQLFSKLGALVTVEDVASCTLLDAGVP